MLFFVIGRKEKKMKEILNESGELIELVMPSAEEIETLIREKKYSELKGKIAALEAVDIASVFGEIDESYINIFYRILPKEYAAEVFVETDAELQQKIIQSFTDRELSEVLQDMYLDDTVDVIEEMPANVVKRILKNSSAKDRTLINQLLRYPKDSAGTVMTVEYVRLTKNMTVGEALSHIREVAIDKETIYTCYVTDKNRHLLGIVTARSLMIALPEEKISNLMDENVIFGTTTEDKESVAQKIEKYGFLALPIVDNEGRLVGIVTVDDAIDVLKEETDEDISKMAAITPTETPYLKTSALNLFKARIPWLLLLMISATISGTILGFFESALIPVLVLFVPMLMDTGGNSGSQASVTAIRALSVGEITVRDVFLVLWKEVRVGFLCGVSLGAVALGKVMLIDRLLLGNEAVTIAVGASVALTVFATIFTAKIIGASLPLLAKRLGLDPAVMASPFITTLVDAVSLIIYFFISAGLFGLTI